MIDGSTTLCIVWDRNACAIFHEAGDGTLYIYCAGQGQGVRCVVPNPCQWIFFHFEVASFQQVSCVTMVMTSSCVVTTALRYGKVYTAEKGAMTRSRK